jgi:hypothetical protein
MEEQNGNRWGRFKYLLTSSESALLLQILAGPKSKQVTLPNKFFLANSSNIAKCGGQMEVPGCSPDVTAVAQRPRAVMMTSLKIEQNMNKAKRPKGSAADRRNFAFARSQSGAPSPASPMAAN